ncbi:hypothetical protein ACFYW8_22650 [Streptomyces sp. NPDC002742]
MPGPTPARGGNGFGTPHDENGLGIHYGPWRPAPGTRRGHGLGVQRR